MSAASFLHSSCLQVINAVILWPVHVQKVPQASDHLCPAKLQTKCDICYACQSFCPFIPTDSGVLRTVDPQTSLSPKTVRALCQSGQPIPDSAFCRTFMVSVRMMAFVICASRWEARHCIACVTASTSMVWLEVVTVGSTVFMYSPSTLLDREPPTKPVPCD